MQAFASEAWRNGRGHRPMVLELSAAGLLAASVILHFVALIPQYYGGPGQGSLWSEPDQAAQYLLLAAGWALALGLAVSSPARKRIGAALVVGVAATEFGFRLADLGEVLRYGSTTAAAGLWLMTAAWVLGACGAVLAVMAVISRRHQAALPPSVYPTTPQSAAGSAGPRPPRSDTTPSKEPDAWGQGAAPRADGTLTSGRSGEAGGATDATADLAGTEGVPDPTMTADLAGTGGVSDPPVAGPAGMAGGSLGAGPTALIALLALATAGAFLPAWDHYAGLAAATGGAVSFNLGDAFSGPWQVVIGTGFAALALLVIPVVATRMRNRATGAAVVAGSLIVLASQFTAAVVQVDNPVPPAVAGLSGAEASRLGLQLHMTLTGWFTLDLLAAFALFVAVMVVGHVREVRQEASSLEPWPPAPSGHPAAGLPPS